MHKKITSPKGVKKENKLVIKPKHTGLNITYGLEKSIVLLHGYRYIDISDLAWHLDIEIDPIVRIIDQGLKYGFINKGHERSFSISSYKYAILELRYAPYLITELFKHKSESLRFELMSYFDNQWIEIIHLIDPESYYYTETFDKHTYREYHPEEKPCLAT